MTERPGEAHEHEGPEAGEQQGQRHRHAPRRDPHRQAKPGHAAEERRAA